MGTVDGVAGPRTSADEENTDCHLWMGVMLVPVSSARVAPDEDPDQACFREGPIGCSSCSRAVSADLGEDYSTHQSKGVFEPSRRGLP